jgi:hypothetical protein
MNWLVFENAPSWFWLHALKPTDNSESAGFGLGFWRPYNDSNFAPDHFPDLPYGHWTWNPPNWNGVAGFIRYMPWDSVRVAVAEDEVRLDNRILAYRFNPAAARWLMPEGAGPQGEGEEAAAEAGVVTVGGDGLEGVIAPAPRPGGDAWRPTHEVLRDPQPSIDAASLLGIVVTSRNSDEPFTFTVSLAAVSGTPTFAGFLYGVNATDVPLGNQTAAVNATTGLPYLSITVQPYSIQFWVQQP